MRRTLTMLALGALGGLLVGLVPKPYLAGAIGAYVGVVFSLGGIIR